MLDNVIRHPNPELRSIFVLPWLYLIGVGLTLANALIGSYFVSRYLGTTEGIVLLLAIAVPHGALLVSSWRSQTRVSFWIRMITWLTFNAIMFAPLVMNLADFELNSLWARVDPTRRPQDSGKFVESMSYFAGFFAVICFPIWLIAEMVVAGAAWVKPTRSALPLGNTQADRPRIWKMIAFVVFEAMAGFVTLAMALGIFPNLDHIPGVINTGRLYPLFTISCTHFLIVVAVLMRTRWGLLALALNLVAWALLIAIGKYI